MSALAATGASMDLAARSELFRTLGVLAEPPEPAVQRLADLLDLPRPSRSDWTEAFVVQLVPHASVYLSSDGMLGGAAADRIAGFWRALRLPVPADPDHLTVLLGLYGRLLDMHREQAPGPARTLLGQARAALLHEHLLSWLLPYLSEMMACAAPAYEQWAGLLREALLAEAAVVAAPDRLPLQLREVSDLPPVAAGPDALLEALLAPARCGLVLSRASLAEVARLVGLGCRLAERRVALRSMLNAAPDAVLAALAELARGWTQRHRGDLSVTGPIGRHWMHRASVIARQLAEAAALVAATGSEDPR